MGWTSSSDMRQQVRLRFDSKDEAIAYCERNGIPYRVFDANPPKRRVMAYADNFPYSRRVPWAHLVRDGAASEGLIELAMAATHGLAWNRHPHDSLGLCNFVSFSC